MNGEPKVDMSFIITGKTVPVDHGFDLYSSICRIVPEFHKSQDIGLKLIRGRYIGDGLLDIQPNSWLVLRLKVSDLPQFINLAGKPLSLQDHTIHVGVPKTRSLIPAHSLYAHLVTTRNGQDQIRFEAEVKRQMDDLTVMGECIIGERKTLTIHDKKVVGYPVEISGLSDVDSIKLQEQGLGGRRKMGCGFFEPAENDL